MKDNISLEQLYKLAKEDDSFDEKVDKAIKRKEADRLIKKTKDKVGTGTIASTLGGASAGGFAGGLGGAAAGAGTGALAGKALKKALGDKHLTRKGALAGMAAGNVLGYLGGVGVGGLRGYRSGKLKKLLIEEREAAKKHEKTSALQEFSDWGYEQVFIKEASRLKDVLKGAGKGGVAGAALGGGFGAGTAAREGIKGIKYRHSNWKQNYGNFPISRSKEVAKGLYKDIGGKDTLESMAGRGAMGALAGGTVGAAVGGTKALLTKQTKPSQVQRIRDAASKAYQTYKKSKKD